MGDRIRRTLIPSREVDDSVSSVQGRDMLSRGWLSTELARVTQYEPPHVI